MAAATASAAMWPTTFTSKSSRVLPQLRQNKVSPSAIVCAGVTALTIPSLDIWATFVAAAPRGAPRGSPSGDWTRLAQQEIPICGGIRVRKITVKGARPSAEYLVEGLTKVDDP